MNISPIFFPDSFNKCVSKAWNVPGTTLSSEDVAVWGGEWGEEILNLMAFLFWWGRQIIS